MKKYILKPGKHQFASGEHARHDNDNLTDAEAKWYLERYPHIAKLFASQPPEVGGIIPDQKTMNTKMRKQKRVRILTPPSGGKGGI